MYPQAADPPRTVPPSAGKGKTRGHAEAKPGFRLSARTAAARKAGSLSAAVRPSADTPERTVGRGVKNVKK